MVNGQTDYNLLYITASDNVILKYRYEIDHRTCHKNYHLILLSFVFLLISASAMRKNFLQNKSNWYL